MTHDLLKKNGSGCPKLFLAPMEGLGSLPFRKAILTIGGFDEACTEFLRVPSDAHIWSLAKKYHHDELKPLPQAVQLMGSNPSTMGDISQLLEQRNAPRIDLNCGCPSNTVTGKGAGASLLKNPTLLYQIAKTMKKSVSIPVTIKLRSGFEDTSLFQENLLAAEESGVDFITLHPRTKKEGYKPPAHWDLIAEAKATIKIPVVGNGDILTVNDALAMLQQTQCDALMIGRGAIINPWLFCEIKAFFSKTPLKKTSQQLQVFLQTFIDHLYEKSSTKNKINHLKQLSCFLMEKNNDLKLQKKQFLRTPFSSVNDLYFELKHLLEKNYFS